MTLMAILIFIVILGVLVLVHELGHFITARRNGIKASEFGFGFPPRIVGVVKDDVAKKYRIVWGSKDVESPNTIYSINWIPLGGFVRIEGEDGSNGDDPKSFASKSTWVRIRVLLAGVAMNFVLAWVLFSAVLFIGAPQAVTSGEQGKYPDAKIQVIEVKPGTPAAMMGLQSGDVIVTLNGTKTTDMRMVSDFIGAHKGTSVAIGIRRGKETETLSGTPRIDYPLTEGSLGFSFTETATISYPIHQALWQGAQMTWSITGATLAAFGHMIGGLFGVGEKVAVDVTGPIGIAYMTKQASALGLVYLIQFAALLSVNLGIINALPIPALDGGRVLFILIEMIKKSPVSQRVEGTLHQVAFFLLIGLMIWVTFHDVAQYHLWSRLMGIL